MYGVRVGPEMHVRKQESGTRLVLNDNTETVSKEENRGKKI